MSSSTKNNQSENERSKAIFNEVLEEFNKRHMDLYKLKDESKLLLKTLSNVLIKVAEANCNQEKKAAENFFDLVNDDVHGFYLEKKQKFEKNEKEANKIMNDFERCLDKQTGVNKKINLFEMGSQSIMMRNKLCVKNCEVQADALSDETLKECFFGCVNELLENMSGLQVEYNQDLQNIINKY